MQKKRFKYIIASTSYTEKYGGVIVLHYMCNLLNSLGEEAYICPIDNFTQYFVSRGTVVKNLLYRIAHPIETLKKTWWFVRQYKEYKTNPKWNTPVISPLRLLFNVGLKDYIVLYSEIVAANPLGANNVTRILMHNPGHFTGWYEYGNNELIFRYSNSFARDFTPPEGSVMSESLITLSAPPSCFSSEGVSEYRKGIAYCIRKGKGKPMVHDMKNAILIDNMPLVEVAKIFKRVKMFVSYDPATAFSYYALLCHCPSIIILGENEKPYTYRPDKESYSMYAYSFDCEDFDWKHSFIQAEDYRNNTNEKSIRNTKKYIAETQIYF